MYSGPLSGQDRSDLHAVTSIETEHGQGQQSLDDMGGCGFGHGGLAPALGHQGLTAVAVGHVLPLVVAGAIDAEDPTGLRHVARPDGRGQTRQCVARK
jgi:hypothetical protein